MRHDRIETVARAAGEVLEHGLAHGWDVLQTIETTLGGAGPEDLATLLADRDTSDAAPLVELLLSPGEDVQVRLEPVLERAGLSEEEAREAADVLAKAMDGRRIAVTLPDGIRLAVDLRPGDGRLFLLRLRPDRTPPAELTAVLDDRGSAGGPDQTARLDRLDRLTRLTKFKVRLRHSRLDWTRTRVSFLARLLAGLDRAETAPPPASMSTLDWALAFLDSIGPDEPPLAGLGLRYRDTLDRMRQAERIQDMLARSNVETLRMQGVLISLPHPDELRRVLALMDLVCRAVTGRPASTFAESPVAEEDLGSHADPASLIQALSRTGD